MSEYCPDLTLQKPFTAHKSGLRKPIIFLLVFNLLMAIGNEAFAQTKTLGMTKVRKGYTEKGYILFGPMGGNLTFLIDKCGREINRWRSDYPPGLSAYLLPDGSLLRAGRLFDTSYNAPGRGGILEKFDWNNNLVWSYVLSNDSLAMHHDFYPMDNGNILVIAWHGIPASEAENKGRYKGTIGGSKLWSERIIELKPKGTNDAEVVWQWSLWDHIIQDESISKPDYNVISAHPELMNVNYNTSSTSDWIHINSIDYNKDLDQIILSCHNTSEIWIIDHSTTTAEAASHYGGKYGKGGDILYRWGNPAAYNKGSKTNQKLFYQHNAHWIPNGMKDAGDIMIFNNGLTRTPSYSSVEVLKPDVSSPGVYKSAIPYGPASFKSTYKDSTPTSFYSPFISGAQRLPNGNTLICSGNQGKLFEIGDKNTLVWQYINPVGGQDVIMTDGNTSPGGNEVFKCVYYADTFRAFKNKNLTPKGPLEKDPVSYSCSPVDPDHTGPTGVRFTPALHTADVSLSTDLQIEFDEAIVRGLSGDIQLFENGVLKEVFTYSDAKITINGNKAAFKASTPFGYASRIGVKIAGGVFKDASGNLSNPVDSANWNFQTIGKPGSIHSGLQSPIRVYPNPVKDKLFVYLPDGNNEPALFNAYGQQVSTDKFHSEQGILWFEMSNLPSGFYHLKLRGYETRKVIKF